jgi:protein TonB
VASIFVVDTINLIKPPEEIKPIEPTPPERQDPPRVEIKSFTPPNIVKDDLVDEKDEVKQQDELNDATIGKIDQTGKPSDIVNPPKVDEGTDVVEKPMVNPETTFTDVQIEAAFPGGTEAWKKYLEKFLDPQLPAEKGAPEGRYTVLIEFVVDKEGNLSDIKALTNLGYGMEEEAIRVIKQTMNKGIRWSPAEQNGMKVKAFRKQPITFVVSE